MNILRTQQRRSDKAYRIEREEAPEGHGMATAHETIRESGPVVINNHLRIDCRLPDQLVVAGAGATVATSGWV